ncbi:MAG: ABC transporter permease [Lentisphaerae bacterium]|nr:MAG: ABC transporter permease [Lentisphaerota bacterium]
MPSIVLIPWRNLWRNRRRTWICIGIITVGQAALLLISAVMHGYARQMQEIITGPMLGDVILAHPRWLKDHEADALFAWQPIKQRLSRDSKVASAGPRLYAPVLAAPKGTGYRALLIGIDFAVEQQSMGMLPGVRPLSDENNEVVIGKRLVRKMKVHPGDEIAIIGQTPDGNVANDLFVIRDIVDSPLQEVNFNGIIAPLAVVQRFLECPDSIHQCVIRLQDQQEMDAWTQQMRRQMEGSGLLVLPWYEHSPHLKNILHLMDTFSYFMLTLVMIATLGGIANTMLMATYERRKEFAVLSALGCSSATILIHLILEAGMLSLIATAVGSLIALIPGVYLQRVGIDLASWTQTGAVRDLTMLGMRIPTLIYPKIKAFDALLGAVAVSMTTVLATLIPGWRATRRKPAEGLRQ